jgi:hypothetical protein
MKCRISQDTYDALKAATLAGDIDSFSFQYVHKGVEFSLKARNNDLSHDEWKDLLLEIYFDNELPEYTGFYPEIEDNELVLDISCSVNLNYDGESRDLWESGEFLLLLQKVLLPIIGAEISQEDIMLDLSMSATEDDMGTLESYSLNYYHSETPKSFDLSKNKIVKDLIKEFVYKWANTKCYMASGPSYSFSVEINESRVGEFYENYSGRVEINVV